MSPLGRAALVAGCLLVLAGCITGQRPSIDTSVTLPSGVTGDAAIDAVLERLERVDDSTFTARYQILTRFGGLTTAAAVAREAESRRSVTVGDVRYLDGPGLDAQTCNLTTGECVSGLDDTRTADTQVTRELYGPSFAQRLRRDATARVSPTRGYNEQIAGATATCVDLPVTGGTKVYCALDEGVLARYDGADVPIDLLEHTDAADEQLFSTTR